MKKGDLGGYIESEDNLSQYDECWVGKTGWVVGNSRVFDDALVDGRIYDGVIRGRAYIGEDSEIHGDVYIGGRSYIEYAFICGA
ncbi:hypothetical protein [Candidatus Liberibacter sp.]|uniref:hypothetical protein n=1 Tax=Candidatus Liberibacter sp. TaxID=34022 RepID=UPI0015F57C97|nr:hypothetical protein [Candidatus Liberibacter sp.]MBA5724609.1 hypothetical protein [Candidatus Liberibacter sp.]